MLQKNKRTLFAIAVLSIASLVQPQNLQAQETQDSKPLPDKIFTSVEERPVPPFEINRYLAENIVYPPDAKKQGIQGRVVLQFVVDKDGSITNVTAVRDIGGGCGQEAMRVVRNMPKWTPGKQGNSPVRVYYTLPISFKLKN